MRKKLACAFVGLIVLASLIPTGVRGSGPQGSFSEQRIRFAPGAHIATVRGQMSRSKAILYKVGAKSGQSMTVRLEGDAKMDSTYLGRSTEAGSRWYPATRSGPAHCRRCDYKIFVFTDDRVNTPFTITVTVE